METTTYGQLEVGDEFIWKDNTWVKIKPKGCCGGKKNNAHVKNKPGEKYKFNPKDEVTLPEPT